MRGPAPDPFDVATFPTRLVRLREVGKFRGVFGAESHQFRVNPPLAEDDARAFERRYGITLPPDYRQFLLTVGNGGAGPHYGVHKLGCADDDKPWTADDWLIGDLAAPFPHTEAWNPLPFAPDDDDEASDEQLREIEPEYLARQHVNGAVPICQQGCNLRYWLVVSGPDAGHVWNDRRVELGGLSPVRSEERPRATFSEWYGEWLCAAEHLCGIPSP